MDRGVANLTLTITMEGIDYLQRELFKIYQGTVASGTILLKLALF